MSSIVLVEDLSSASIAQSARSMGLGSVTLLGTYDHPAHPGSADYSVRLYQVGSVRAIETNADPIWEESDPALFAEVLAEYRVPRGVGRPPVDQATATSHIHLRVTPERKSAYVRAAQSQGQNLSDWMTDTCDAAAGSPPATSITGGKKGFSAAIDEAFRAKLHDPTIRYSHKRGFHVESAHVPADPDVIWSAAANYVIPSGRRSVRPADWAEVRAHILGE